MVGGFKNGLIFKDVHWINAAEGRILRQAVVDTT
jgi:hypothetical protein